ncbi:MAG: TrbC/VirB2 family protein [Patescibacteria group bacterium]
MKARIFNFQFSIFKTVWRYTVAIIVYAVPVIAAAQQTLENPLRFSSLETFIEGVLQAVVMVALPIIVAFIVYAGFKYIFARGSIDKIKDAHKNFTYVIIGTILILGAWVLATLIGGTVTQLLGN